MIARAKKRRAQQDKNPYCREHSESNTEHGHLLTPLIPNSPVKVYHTTGSEEYAAKKADRAVARPPELRRWPNQLPSMVLITLDIGRAVSRPPPISLSTMSTYSFLGSVGVLPTTWTTL